MKRIITKIGDIFSVDVDNDKNKYFQSIAVDNTQLGSSVIRAFKKEYSHERKPSPAEIIQDEVDFYAHCSTKLGAKLNLWQKIGNVNDVGSLKDIIFRDTDDYGSKPGEQVKISYKWHVWRINDAKFTYVGRLEGKFKDAEIGVVVNPYDIVYRLKTGKYNFVYPGF